MAVKKVKVDRDLCIGAAPCVVAAASVFELDDESKAVMKLKDGTKTSDAVEKSALEDAGISDDMLVAAAQSCPVKAIFVYDENDQEMSI